MAEHSRLPSLAVSPLSDGHDDDRRVRVRRFAGIDRGTVTPSLLVLALAVLMSVVLPSSNRETPYRHPVHKGDIAELAGGISLVPTAEWDLASGTLRPHALGGRQHGIRAQRTPEALKGLSVEIRKQKTELGPPGPKGDGAKS